MYIGNERKNSRCCNSGASFSRLNASMVLEGQLRKMDSTVSDFEKQLSDDGAIPDKPSAIQARTQEIQVIIHS